MKHILCIVLFSLIVTLSYQEEYQHSHSARIESCRGCSLNRLPEVKAFIFEDVPQYEGVEFKSIPGAQPIIRFFNKDEKEIEMMNLSSFNRVQLNKMLEEHGFKKKEAQDKNEL